MKSYTTVFATLLLFFTFCFINTENATSKKNGKIPGRTNAPGDGKCTNCHSGAEGFNGNVNISFENPSLKYIEGETYSITLSVEDEMQEKFGFQITVLTDELVSSSSESPISGGFIETGEFEAANTSDNRYYLSHNSPNSSGNWTFDWIAPDENVGPIHFYFTGLAVNDNNSTSGDHVYFNQLTIEPEPVNDPCPEFINPIFTSSPKCSGAPFTDLGIEISESLPLGMDDGPYFYYSEDPNFNPYDLEGNELINGFAGYTLSNNNCENIKYYLKSALIKHDGTSIQDGPPDNPECQPVFSLGIVTVHPNIEIAEIDQNNCLITITANCPTILVNGSLGSSVEEIFGPNEAVQFDLSFPGSNCSISISQNYSCEPIDPLLLEVKTFLQGFYNTEDDEMTTAFQDLDLFPLEQPYSVEPFNYSGEETIEEIPTEAVDWVLVEIRTEENPDSLLSRKAALLYSNGQIHQTDGSSSIAFSNLSAGNYHVVVRHRNHLAVMTNESIALPNLTSYDFSTSEDQANGTEQLIMIDEETYGQYAGDFSANGIINSSDFNIWISDNAAVNQYLLQDADGNGLVNNLDYNAWFLNRSKVGSEFIQIEE